MIDLALVHVTCCTNLVDHKKSRMKQCWLWYIYHKWKQMNHEHKMSTYLWLQQYTIPGQTATTLADDEIETMQPSAHAVKSGWAKAGMNEISTQKIGLKSWSNSHQLWFPVWDSLFCKPALVKNLKMPINLCKTSHYPLVRWHYLTPQWQMKLHGNIEFLEPPLTKAIFLIFGVVSGY